MNSVWLWARNHRKRICLSHERERGAVYRNEKKKGNTQAEKSSRFLYEAFEAIADELQD